MRSITFNLFGTSWTMTFISEIKTKDNYWKLGDTDSVHSTMTVSTKDTKNNPLNDDLIKNIAIHELVHSILSTGQYNEASRNENLVEWIARSVQSLYKQKVFQKILGE